MKKIYAFILLFACSLIQAQTTSTVSVSNKTETTSVKQSRYYNAWRLGLNMGAMWQVADVRSTPGFAGGFTLEKGFCENKTNFFSWAIKGRGLFGTTYGLDYNRNYDVKTNPALNGKYNPKVNYDSTSDYIYNNYRTEINEGALELQICFNRLRERTNILLNIWGGIGFTSYRTKINLLNSTNGMYNYRLVDSTGGEGNIVSSHKFLLDKTYESNAKYSQNGNILTLSPSCGIGLGYKFNDYISILWEHKITFPQGTYSDYLDGIQGSNNDWLGCVKDYYHYSSLNLLIRLGGGKGKTKSNTTNVNNYTPVQTNTVVTNPTTSVTIPTNTVVAAPQKPIVNITNPPSSPYSESVITNFTVVAKVYNVNNRNEVTVMLNGSPITNYSWFAKTISFVAPLSIGNNVVVVSATNTAGSDSKSAIINYNGMPPQITITTPGGNKITSTQNIADVYATILNVESANNIAVKYNSQPVNSFNYNPSDKSFNMQVTLNKGTNTVEITATNAFGKDIKSQLVIYSPSLTSPTVTASRAVSVVITDPSVNPYKSASQIYKVKAKVVGVTSASQVTVTANAVQIPFNYINGAVDFDVNLNVGNNLVQVSARNGKSSDSKSTILTYEEPKKASPPSVVIINPQPSPYTTSATTYAFKAQTQKISSNSQLEVKYNGLTISNYVFDANSGVIDYNAGLTANSNNFFEVKVTNSFGSANASAVVKQEMPQTKVICHKKDRINYETITINESEWAAHQAHGDYDGACKPIVTDPPVDPQITICHHNNSDGSNQTIQIPQSTWAQHLAHGDVMGACPTQTVVIEDKKITICHIPPGNPNNPQTIEINESAWPAHQAHGDTKGVCPKVIAPTDPIEIDKKITICHIPPGNPNNPQTIEINESAWPAHQAHGDTKGVCPKVIAPTDPIEIEKKITICHIPPGNSSNPQTIEINESAWPAHQAHGDYKGVCAAQNNNSVTPTAPIEICHKNADGSKITMLITATSWPMHQLHGDTQGKCPAEQQSNTTATPSNSVVICHKNGDGSTETMTIHKMKLSEHKAHGDTEGECPVQKVITPGGGRKTGELKSGTSETEKKESEKPAATPTAQPQETIKMKPR